MTDAGSFDAGDWAELCPYGDGEHREVALTDVQLAVIGLMLGLGRESPFADDELAEKILPAAIEASCR